MRRGARSGVTPVTRQRSHRAMDGQLRGRRELFLHVDGLKTTVTYGEGETIFHEDGRCQSVFAVCEGSVNRRERGARMMTRRG